MYGLLSQTLLALAGLTSALPSQATWAGLRFNVKNYVFKGEGIYSTPAHLAVTESQANFTLDIPFIPATVCCSAELYGEWPDFDFGINWYPCHKSDSVSAAFRLAEPPGELELQVNWTTPRLAFSAEGKAEIDSQKTCVNSEWTNPNWTIGDIYTIYYRNCSIPKRTVYVTDLTGVAR